MEYQYIAVDNDLETVDFYVVNSVGKILDKSFGISISSIVINRSAHLTVLLKSPNVTTREVLLPANSPSRKKAQIAAAIIEEQLLDDIEELHFAVSEKPIDNMHAVAIIRKNELENIIHLLQHHGIVAQVITPYYLFFPVREYTWFVAYTNKMAWCRIDHYNGFAVEPETIKDVLKIVAAERGKPEVIEVHTVNDAEDQTEGFKLNDVEIKPHSENVIQFREPPLINLLQGEFSTNHNKILNKKSAVLHSAALTLLLFVVFGVYQVRSYSQLKDYNDELKQEVNKIYLQLYPEAKSVVSPKLRVTQELNQLRQKGSGNQFTSLLSQVGAIVHNERQAEIHSINYVDGTLQILLIAEGYQSIDKIINNLKNNGLIIAQKKTEKSDERISSILLIEYQ